MDNNGLLQLMAGSQTTEIDLQRQAAAIDTVRRVVAQLELLEQDPNAEVGRIGFVTFTFADIDDEVREYKQDIDSLTLEEKLSLLPLYRIMATRIQSQLHAAFDNKIGAMARIKEVLDAEKAPPQVPIVQGAANQVPPAAAQPQQAAPQATVQPQQQPAVVYPGQQQPQTMVPPQQ